MQLIDHPAVPAPSVAAEVVRQGWVHSIDSDERFTLRRGTELIAVNCTLPRPLATLADLHLEDVVEARGTESSSELECTALTVLNRCQNPPFTVATSDAAPAALRARFRYLELRSPRLQHVLGRRHRFTHEISCALDRSGFIAVETPILAAPSPSGAREFQVVSTRTTTLTYALPQSAQVYGQLLVMSGVERYYQWSRCFRDEDLRVNRQPEFTQLHVEAAFVDEMQLRSLLESVLAEACAAIDVPWVGSVPVLTYDQAMRRYGTDQPDLRYELSSELLPFRVADPRSTGELNLFVTTWPPGAEVRLADVSPIHDLGAQQHFTLLGFCDRQHTTRHYLTPRPTTEQLATELGVQPQPGPGLVPVWAGNWSNADALVRALYTYLTQTYPPPTSAPRLVWITEFPLFELDEEQPGRLLPRNSPFTAPLDEAELLGAHKNKAILQLKSRAFDLVLNGQEIASGSILIHSREVQQHVFNTLNMSRKDVRANYGFIMDALSYGAPPMGGLGLGLDRTLAGLLGLDKIRDVIAFPKTRQGYCPVTRVEPGAVGPSAPR